MDWLEGLGVALDYLEAHLQGQLDIVGAARAAYSSPFHFQRMFSLLSGITVAEYVRRRRLTLAAQELALGKAKVLDVALKYGYDSPESFTKAFRKLHGCNPSAAREPGAPLKAYPRLTFHLSPRGDQEMDYRLVEEPAFRIAGRILRTTTHDNENQQSIAKFWTRSRQEGLVDRLSRMGIEVLGVCLDAVEGQEEFGYMIAAKLTGEEFIPSDLETREIPASTWAVFPSIGPMPGAIQKVWERIYREWLPATGNQHAGGPDFELYPSGDAQSPDYHCEVWIPIVKK